MVSFKRSHKGTNVPAEVGDSTTRSARSYRRSPGSLDISFQRCFLAEPRELLYLRVEIRRGGVRIDQRTLIRANQVADLAVAQVADLRAVPIAPDALFLPAREGLGVGPQQHLPFPLVEGLRRAPEGSSRRRNASTLTPKVLAPVSSALSLQFSLREGTISVKPSTAARGIKMAAAIALHRTSRRRSADVGRLGTMSQRLLVCKMRWAH
jgi:hypothetical protein